MKLVVSAFPGTGKSTIFNHADQLGLKQSHVSFDEHGDSELTVPAGPLVPVFDSDSSKFNKEHFPGNYIKHIGSVANHDTINEVVILVSSHDNVREAMREAGIEYILVYPAMELKADYIERYKQRGSPEAFVNMMEDKWVDFITSCQNDPTKYKIELQEGEYLIDRLKPFMGHIAGLENIGDVIIEVNGDASIVAVAGEPDGDNDPSVLNIPENLSASDIDNSQAQGGQSSGDPEIDDNASSDNSPVNLNTTIDGIEHNHTDLLEVKLDMQNDVDLLEEVITKCQNQEVRDAIPNMEDNGPILTEAATVIGERYKTEVDPTLAGMESFFGTLKEALVKVGKALTGSEGKPKKGLIGKSLSEVKTAVKQYTSPKWLGDQKWINVGNANLDIPAVFKEVNTGSGIAPIIGQFVNSLNKDFTEQLKIGKGRLNSGVKIFNSLKKADPKEGDFNAVISAKGKVTPERTQDLKLADLVGLINLETSKGELPVLKKADIAGVIKPITDALDVLSKMSYDLSNFTEDSLTPDDFYDYPFWEKAFTGNGEKAREIWSAVCFEDNGHNMEMITDALIKQLLVIAKFVEQWILKSIK
jgi:hypothetical protein